MTRYFVKLFLAASLMVSTSHGGIAINSGGTLAGLAAGAIAFTSTTFVALSIDSSYEKTMTFFAGCIFSIIALGTENQNGEIGPITLDVAGRAGITDEEMTAFNRELPTINAIFQSAGLLETVPERVAYIQGNKTHLSDWTQQALVKLYQTRR